MSAFNVVFNDEIVSAKDLAEIAERYGIKDTWYNMVGMFIARPVSNWASGWGGVKATLWDSMNSDLGTMNAEEREARVRKMNMVLQPYFDFIDYLNAEGFTSESQARVVYTKDGVVRHETYMVTSLPKVRDKISYDEIYVLEFNI